MTERERNASRRDYFKAYAAANRAKRREANRRWVAKQKAVAIAAAQPIIVPREIEGLTARFLAYRTAKKQRIAQ